MAEPAEGEVLDAIVVGAGFGGLYMLHRLQEEGYRAHLYEAASGVGGVWYWNAYPGARCDIESIYYCYIFSEKIYRTWSWSHKYSDQAELLAYMNYVADELGLRPHMTFDTRVVEAAWDEAANLWRLTLPDGRKVSARYFIPATGTLSEPNLPDIPHLSDFKGEVYNTARWPKAPVSFEGKRVGVMGTGASGIQSIPVIAQTAKEVVVLQRTAHYSLPARNFRYTPEATAKVKADYERMAKAMWVSRSGYPVDPPQGKSALDDTKEDRDAIYQDIWDKGHNASVAIYAYDDLMLSEEANATISDFYRTKIRGLIDDPDVAEKLTPKYYFGGKRTPKDTHYFETFNQPHVRLVDLKAEPITGAYEGGLTTGKSQIPLDMIVFATGFDAMTGPLVKLNVIGRGGVTLRQKWLEGDTLAAYLGLANTGFPNMFTVAGPLGPGVSVVVPILSEFIGDWIIDCIKYVDQHGYKAIEATPQAEAEWTDANSARYARSLASKVPSWYNGGNISGKRRTPLSFNGGFQMFMRICRESAAEGYKGFVLSKAPEHQAQPAKVPAA